MATITKKGDKFYVEIRKKGSPSINVTLSDRETADLYAWWKESTMDDMEVFDVPEGELLTVYDCIMIKKEENAKEGRQEDDMHLNSCLSFFEKTGHGNSPVQSLNNEVFIDITKKAFKLVVQRGGNKHDLTTGTLKPMSPFTLRRHFAMLSSAISKCQEKGFKISNPVKEFMPFFREKFLQKKGENEQ